MKLLISLLFLLPLISEARVIVMSYPMDQHAHAQYLVDKMESEFHIPREFIEMISSSQPCIPNRQEVSWHLCVDFHGDLQEVTVDPSFIRETLRVFL